MAALAYPRPDISITPRVSGGRSHPGERHLELVWSKPRLNRLSKSVYLRRRVAALVLVALVGVGVSTLISAGVSWLSTTPSQGVEAAVNVSSNEWIVGPGDTLWEIARSVQPSGDIRPLVSELSAERNGVPLQVGERVRLPSH